MNMALAEPLAAAPAGDGTDDRPEVTS
jgi:hypothetical protein